MAFSDACIARMVSTISVFISNLESQGFQLIICFILELMKDHLSEIHPYEMAFICQIKKVIDADNLASEELTDDVCLRDLFDECLTEIKEIKVKTSSETKYFYEKKRKERRMMKEIKTKPFLMITEAYSMAKESLN